MRVITVLFILLCCQSSIAQSICTDMQNARIHIEKDSFGKMRKIYSDCLVQSPNDLSVLNNYLLLSKISNSEEELSPLLQKAYALCRTPEDSLNVMYRKISILRKKENDFSEATELAQNAIEIAQNGQLEDWKKRIELELAIIHINTNNPKLGKAYIQKNIITLDLIQDPHLKADYLYDWATYLFADGKFQNALDTLIISKEIYEKDSLLFSLAKNMELIGSCYTMMENNEKAKENYNKSKSISEQIRDSIGMASSWCNIGNLYYEKQEDNDATNAYNKAINYANPKKSLNVLYNAFYNLHIIYEAAKDINQALNHLKKANEYKASIDEKTRVKDILALDFKYQTQQKEQRIKILNQEYEISAFRNKAMTIIIISGLIALAIILFLYNRTRKLNKTISEKNEELEEVNIFKNQIFSIMGHDMRGKLSKLNASQKKLLRSSKHDDTAKIGEAVNKMGGMIHEINGFSENTLYWGMSMSDKLNLDFKEQSLKQLVREVVFNFNYDLELKQIKIDNLIEDSTEVFIDKNSIKVVIRNIISNAIKFTETNGNIRITAEKDNNATLLKITDNGKGIPKEIIPTLFDTNPNKIKDGTQGEKGTGMGLWLCKEMMRKNNGDIKVESQENNGTTFILEIPNHN